MLRSPSKDEVRLLEFLLSKAQIGVLSEDWRAKLRVSEMEDGGMGSLRLFPDGSQVEDRKFGRRASECQFTDEDGVEVLASLNLDQDGNLYELDIWKTDFGKLIRIPAQLA